MFRIKICGITTAADARLAAECGADAVGLNFYAKSPRFVTDELAAAIVRDLPERTAAVGVFVDGPDEQILAAARRHALWGVQTYGVTRDFQPFAHIPAFRVRDGSSLDSIRQYVQRGPSVTAVLVDSHVPGEMGGTGHRAPWELLAGFDPGVPLILAGGLTPDNVAEAIRIVRPWGVDVASGVESAPGKKDPGKVRAFIQAARAAGT